MRRLVILALLLTSAPLPLAAQPASAISAQDRAQGAEANPKLLAEYGGAFPGRQADYVRSVGQRIAVQSGLSNAQSDFTVTLLNSPVNNAFAIPGGYVYITRQLLALVNDEAELAAVMGHEVGHVAARHSQSRAQTSSIAGVLAGVLGAVVGNSGLGSLVGRGAGAVAQLVTLKFSRTQEFQADDLGVTYLARGGYDPTALSLMLTSLAAQEALDARLAGRNGRGPSWASTHPDPASRVARARAAALATGVTGGQRNRDAYLAAIDGMLYGDDPKQGVVEGQVFRHPGLRIAFNAPEGYVMTNGADAVTISGPGGQAQFSGGAATRDLDAYVRQVLGRATGNASLDPGPIQRGQQNGFDTASVTIRADTQSGPVDVTVFAYAFDARTAYHFLTITAAGTGIGPFGPAIDSLRRLSPAQVADFRARRISVVTVGANDTLASLSARMAYPTLRTERFQVLNALLPGAPLRPGRKVKLVVWG